MSLQTQPSTDAPEGDAPQALALVGVTKTFPGVTALDDVSFSVRPGEVHALVGENGAGKSTLMAVASGSLQPDDGFVRIGETILGGGPEVARRMGLAIVRQHPALLPDLSVAENMLLAQENGVSVPHAKAWAQGVLRQWDADSPVSSTALTNTLVPEHRFVTEITKCLAQQPRVLVLDEPTEHLGAANVARLFTRIRALAQAGTAVVYISHRIREVMAIADRVTILRDGRSQGTFERTDLTENEIIRLIAGRPLAAIFPDKVSPGEEVAVAITALTGARFADIDLDIRRGEVVGLAGIEGNGQREFLRALAGLEPAQGQVVVNGVRVRAADPKQAMAAGLVYVPSDRPGEAIIGKYSVRSNLTLRSGAQFTAKLGWRDRRRQEVMARDGAARFKVKSPSLSVPIGTLSGGNQQKVVLSSVLSTNPSILLADEPTQGVDVGTRSEIYEHLRNCAAEGASVLMLSSDALELAGLCDRVLVFSRGSVVATLTGDEVSEPSIASAIVTSTAHRVERPASGHRLAAALAGHLGPLVLLAIASVVLATGASAVNDRYLSAYNIASILVLTATLALVAFGQQAIMLIGGIDLSVGSLMGFLVVVQSFYLVDNATAVNQLSGWLLLITIPLAVGTLNWVLVDVAGLSSVIATLATYMALQAASLILRPVPGGSFSQPILDAISAQVGPVPVIFISVVLLAIALEAWLLFSRSGVKLRAVGSDLAVAGALGVRVRAYRWFAFVGCSLLAGVAAIPLMAQVGSGNPQAGSSYMLTSIAATAVGGASLFGGRGSFVGALLGALLLTQVNAVTSFLGLDSSWTWYILGAALIGAVALYSTSRQRVVTG